MLLKSTISNCILIIIALQIHRSYAAIHCQDHNAVLLNNTNAKRKLHGVPPLTLNEILIDSSIQHAQVLAKANTIFHAHGDFGENLFASWGKNFESTSTDYGAIDAFYSEISCYCGYETSCPACVYGHFTQLIWKSSTSQGCGACINDANKMFVVVCRYLPGGNVQGDFDSNVLPPFGNQEPLLDAITNAEGKDIAIASAILLVFFAIIILSFKFNSED